MKKKNEGMACFETQAIFLWVKTKEIIIFSQ